MVGVRAFNRADTSCVASYADWVTIARAMHKGGIVAVVLEAKVARHVGRMILHGIWASEWVATSAVMGRSASC